MTGIHRKTKCNSNFNTPGKLKVHKLEKHQEDYYPCDHYKFKAESIKALDVHIASFHQSKRSKDVDMQSLKNRSPCNFSDPAHTSKCCDRVPGPPCKYFIQKERLQNGPYRNWLDSECFFEELCKFSRYAAFKNNVAISKPVGIFIMMGATKIF